MLALNIPLISPKGVYTPREDSYLLAKAVEKHAKGDVLDMGCGTGIQGIVAAKLSCKVVFADIDENALKCAEENTKMNGVSGKFVLTTLFSNIKGKFDTIIFNPPYVPTSPLKILRNADPTTDGGVMGREVIKRFLNNYKTFLNDDGIALILESSLNKYESDLKKGAEVVELENLFFEKLAVLKFR